MIKTTQLRAVYAMLREFPPFNRWGLPPADQVKFELIEPPDLAEFSEDDDGRLTIAINPLKHVWLYQIIESVAHEAVHMRQHMLDRLPVSDTKHHNKEFDKMAWQVCKELGMNPQTF